MLQDLQRALRAESTAYITTYDAGGHPGTVPVWFVYTGGKVYLSTGRDSVKARKLRADPRVRVAFGRREGPALEGKARFCAEEALVTHIVPLLNRKYGGYYGPNDDVVRGLLEGPSALVEVTPDPS